VLGEPALEVLLQLVELVSQRVPYFDNPPECDEGAHDLDVHRYCATTSKDTRKHRYALLSEDVGHEAPATVRLT
jgi:hypothetical protein